MYWCRFEVKMETLCISKSCLLLHKSQLKACYNFSSHPHGYRPYIARAIGVLIKNSSVFFPILVALEKMNKYRQIRKPFLKK